MNAAELRELNDAELANRLREFREELFNLHVKKDIARCETLLREREIAAAEALKEHA